MIEKTDVIGGLDLPEKAEHTRRRRRMKIIGNCICSYLMTMALVFSSSVTSFGRDHETKTISAQTR